MTDSVYAWSQTAADNASADATVNFAEFQTPSSVNDSARALMARVAELVSDLAPKRTSTGSGNAYAVTSDAAGATLRNGESITFIPHASNTGACTLNVAGRGAKNWRPKAATSFAADNILAGVPVTAYYNLSTDEWISPGTGYYVTNLASGVALQSITARLPQIGDLVVSLAPTPGAGRIRLTEATQSLLKADWPELNTWLSGHSYPWGSTATHFSLPPAAGYFLRFASTTSAIDTSGARAAGSVQTDQNKTASIPASGLTAATTVSAVAPTFRYNVSSVFQNGGGNAAVTDISTASGGVQVTTSSVTPTASTALSGSATLAGGDEVRTKNVAFHVEIVASSALAAAQVACFGLPYVWDTGTTAADPGSGRIRGNNAALGSITTLYVSKTDALGVDLSGTISGWSSGTILNLSKVGAQANRLLAEVTSTPVDNTTYYTIAIAVTTPAGALSDNIAIEFARVGSDGVTLPDISGLPVATPDFTVDIGIMYDVSAAAHRAYLLSSVMPLTTRGDLFVRDATGPARLAVGTSGYMLSSNGTDPLWVGYTNGGAGAAVRTWTSKLSETALSVTDFSGADSTGVADSLAAFVAAVTFLPAAGGTIQVPAGTWKLSGPLPLTKQIKLVGAGPQATKLVTSSATANILDVDSNFCTIEDIGFSSSVTRTGGAYIDITSVSRTKVSNFYMDGYFLGIRLDAAPIQTIEKGEFRDGVGGTGCGMIDIGNNSVETNLRNLVADKAALPMPQFGIKVTYADATNIDNCDIIRHGYDLWICPGASQVVTSIKSVNTYFDSATTGIRIVPTHATGVVQFAQFVGSWSSSHTDKGVYISNTAGGTIDGVEFIGHQACLSDFGVLLDGTPKNVRYTGGVIAANTGDGVIVGAGVSEFWFHRVRMGPSDAQAGNGGYAVNILAGASNNYGITECDVRGNTTGTINDGGTGTTKFITNNLGHTTNLYAASLVPTTTGLDLGTSAKPWRNGYLASGGILDFGAGDITLTHSANLLTLAGGNLTVDGALSTTGAITSGGNLIVGGDLTKNVANGNLAFYGGNAFDAGAGVVLFGESHATAPDQIWFANSNFTTRLVIEQDGTLDYKKAPTTAGAPFTNTGKVTVKINGTSYGLMLCAA